MPKRKNILKKWAEQIKFGKKGRFATKVQHKEESYYKKVGAWKQTTKKQEITAQFMAQPSKYVQRIESIGQEKQSIKGLPMGKEKIGRTIPMRLKFEKGKSIIDYFPKDSKYIHENRNAIARELAKAVADIHLKYGIMHLDLEATNILIKKGKKPEVKLIDFAHGKEIAEKKHQLESSKEMLREEFDTLRYTTDWMCKTEKEQKELWKLFQKEYEKAANKIL